ncbi:MAG: hypothetical protein EPO64_06185 [Nitrospirae bacterium]|nr:MAG: hypothetical protein EPO64_06185 [Nitrospirota bacterium]
MIDRATDQDVERLAWLALLPVLSTTLYYALPADLQRLWTIQFAPQVLAYLGLAIWAGRNRAILTKLGLSPSLLVQGLRWGIPTGLALGVVNVSVILWLVPFIGGDIDFLRHTPHAQAPAVMMLPWAILIIAVGVELNFRGFLLGRLLALCSGSSIPSRLSPALALGGSALVFSFDPFMTATFKHLHWIALWDGMVWGVLWLCLRNLYATIAAHAVEVIVMYAVLKVVLS